MRSRLLRQCQRQPKATADANAYLACEDNYSHQYQVRLKIIKTMGKANAETNGKHKQKINYSYQ